MTCSTPNGSLDGLTDVDLELVYQFICNRYCDDLQLDDLATAAQTPKPRLMRAFDRRHGTTPMRWLWAFRTLLAAELISRAPGDDLRLIGRRCGFASPAHFSRRFRELFQESPRSFRQNFRFKVKAVQPVMSHYDLTSNVVAKLAGMNWSHNGRKLLYPFDHFVWASTNPVNCPRLQTNQAAQCNL